MEEIKNVPYKLPDGWKWVKLGDIGKINPKKSEIKDLLEKNIEVSFVPMKFVDDVNGEITYSETKLIKDVYKGYTYFRSGDIIFAKITPCMENGKCAIAKNLVNDIGFGSTEFHVIRVSENINKKLIWFYLRFSKIREEAKKYFTGAVGQKRVPAAFLQNLLIPIPFKNGKPDLEKQKEIVAKIEEIFQRIKKAEELQKRSLQATKAIFNSALNKIFENAREEDGWEWMEFKNIGSIIRGVNFKKADSLSVNKKGFIPVITATNIVGDSLVKEKLIYVPSEKSKPEQRIKENDILIVMSTGSKKALGRVYFSKNDEDVFIGAFLGIIRVSTPYDSKFFYYFTLTHIFRNHLLSYKGSQINNIGINKFNNLLIPVPFKNGKPDLEKQKEIAEYLDKLNNKVKQLKELQTKEMEKLNKLKDSVLDKAFRGELV